MPDHALEILIAVYVVWITSILLSMYLLLTERASAYSFTSAVLWGGNCGSLLFLLYAITDAAGAF